MRKLIRPLILIVMGGLIYAIIEILYRGYTHWTMIIVGGLAFYFIGLLNEHVKWNVPIINQMAISTVIVTVIEFITGVIVNIILKWNVWDYSNVPLNLFGQICLPFCLIWFVLSFFAIMLDDFIRYWFFNENFPHYKMF